DLKAAERIAEALSQKYRLFPKAEFLRDLKKELAPLELKGRMQLLRSRIELTLPPDPRKSIPILMDATRQNEDDDEGLSGFLVWPLTDYVAKNGLVHFELSMKALH